MGGILVSTAGTLTTPGIVTNGLQLYLDAGKTASYPGSGSTWFDLSANNNNGTINQAVFDSVNKYFTFDGIDDSVQLASDYYPEIKNDFTVELWCQPSNTISLYIDSSSTPPFTASYFAALGTNKFAIGAVSTGSDGSGVGISVGTNGVSIVEHAADFMPAPLNYSTSIIQMTNIVLVYSNRQPNLYINSQFAKTGVQSSKANVYLPGNLIATGDYGKFAGNIAILRYYSRSLTNSEILQNFNADKSRFGL